MWPVERFASSDASFPRWRLELDRDQLAALDLDYGATLREIGTAFGPLAGKVWRFGAMGYNARKHKILITLGALEAVLRAEGHGCPPGEAVDAALSAWNAR